MKRKRIVTLTLLIALGVAAAASADEAATWFRQNCMSCHTIGGGRLVGPDLKDVSKRVDREWLLKFMVNPKSFLDSGDPLALKLKEEARGAIMPNISGLDAAKAASLLTLIENESKLPKSQFIGLNLSDQPFTSVDADNGRRIFNGTKRLANGGAACLSCHSVDDLRTLGGGRLGPDLTKVYERMNGRKNLASWLMAPATPTMRPLFANNAMTNDEIVALVAYLETSAKKPPSNGDTSTLSFFFLGLGGAVFGFIGADTVWRKRFRGVRKPMLEKSSRGDR
ncbi:MAG TPA: cytochrome c [Thermoanaerobaculia bacterium]|nr:cytochrome c [Thermoanaerobaculia bacterium]